MFISDGVFLIGRDRKCYTFYKFIGSVATGQALRLASEESNQTKTSLKLIGR